MSKYLSTLKNIFEGGASIIEAATSFIVNSPSFANGYTNESLTNGKTYYYKIIGVLTDNPFKNWTGTLTKLPLIAPAFKYLKDKTR